MPIAVNLGAPVPVDQQAAGGKLVDDLVHGLAGYGESQRQKL